MGDGAVRQGSLHETLNPPLWQLPVVFVVENGYAMGTSVAELLLIKRYGN